jgi:hypothetical protein
MAPSASSQKQIAPFDRRRSLAVCDSSESRLRSECPGEVGAGADHVGVEVVEPLKLRDLEFANSIPLTEDSP